MSKVRRRTTGWRCAIGAMISWIALATVASGQGAGSAALATTASERDSMVSRIDARKTLRDAARAGATAVTLRRQEIQLAGWKRVAELLEGAVGTSRTSVDGFVYSVAGDRLASSEDRTLVPTEWLVLVDGVRMLASANGLTFTELVPVTIDLVDSVRFTPGPSIVAGIPAPRGALEIFTARSQRGFGVGASIAIGDETGDPGAFRYTDRATPNVEKIGPFADVHVRYGARYATLTALYHHATFTSSDSNIMRRLPADAFVRSRQYSEARTKSLRLDLHKAGEHSLLVSRGDQFGLMYMPSDRGEADVTLASSTIALRGSAAPRLGDVSYGVTSASLTLTPVRFVLADVDTTTRRLVSAHTNVRRTWQRLSAGLGAQLNHWRMETGAVQSVVRGAQVHAEAQASVSDHSAASLLVGIVRTDFPMRTDSARIHPVEDRFHRLNVALGWRTQFAPATNLRLSLTRLAYNPGDDGSWIDRIVRAESYTPAATLRGAAALEHHTRLFRIGINASYSELKLQQPELAPITRGSRLDPAQTRRVASAALDIESDTGNFVFLRLIASTSLVGGDNAFRLQARSLPANEVRATVSLRPFQGVRTSAIAHLASGSEWFASDNLALQSAPPLRRLDLSFEKWAFKDALRAGLVFRNVLNRPEQSHALGAQWNFRTLVSLSVLAL